MISLPRAILSRVSLAPKTTFAVGGRARWYCRVSQPEDLVAAVDYARKRRWRWFVLAGGSNVVAGDGVFDGLVIHYYQGVGRRPKVRGRQIICEVGIPLVLLIKTAIKHGLGGLETLSGIPGTVGGAIVGNAGAYGQTISDCLARVEIFDLKKTRWLSRKQCRFAYRESAFKRRPWLALRAEFVLPPADSKALARKAREIIQLRQKKYRPGLLCPGSFFKNVLVKDIPQKLLAKIDKTKIIDGKIPAGWLLEEVGAKGLRLGKVRIADFHGNLLINEGGAACRDVRRLAALLKRRVRSRFGIRLVEEVRYLV